MNLVAQARAIRIRDDEQDKLESSYKLFELCPFRLINESEQAPTYPEFDPDSSYQIPHKAIIMERKREKRTWPSSSRLKCIHAACITVTSLSSTHRNRTIE